jgi:biotin transport system substrate-specific component
MTLRLLLLSTIFAILTAVSSMFIIPFPLVPITLQVAVMLLSGLLLGARGGAISQAFYVLLGLIGLPVFAGGVGGIQHIFSPTFGFLLGFIVAAATTGLLARRARSFYSCFLSCLVGIAAMYASALPILFINLKYVAGMDIGVIKLFQIGLLPFIIPDVVKACIASVVAVRLNSYFYIYGNYDKRK